MLVCSDAACGVPGCGVLTVFECSMCCALMRHVCCARMRHYCCARVQRVSCARVRHVLCSDAACLLCRYTVKYAELQRFVGHHGLVSSVLIHLASRQHLVVS